MGPKIFISHSTSKDPKSREILEHLRDHLIVQGFDPFIDYHDIPPSIHWRQFLLDTLDECQGGVVLLNKDALTESDWVHTEASILRWKNIIALRRQERGAYRDPIKFPLAIVCLGNITPKKIRKNSKWGVLDFLQMQLLPGGEQVLSAENETEIFEKISKLFSPLKELSKEKTPLQEILDSMVDALTIAKFDPEELSGFLYTKHWDFYGDEKIERRIAKWIWVNGLDGLNNFFDEFKLRLISQERKESMLALAKTIAPMWIDHKDMSLLHRAVTIKEDEKRACSSNGKKFDFTPKMYIQHACLHDTRLDWDSIVIPFVYDPRRMVQDILEQVERYLIIQFLSDENLDYFDTLSWEDREPLREEIRQELNKEKSNHSSAIFVNFPPQLSEKKELIDAIRAEFPTLTFFFLTDGDMKKLPVESIKLTDLDLNKEEARRSQFNRIKRHCRC